MSFQTLTTPFGRRPLTLAQVTSQLHADARPREKAVHKWQVFRAICAAKANLAVSERALAVLDALLSFHPETTLGGEGTIVFPSNQQLALRAHGMAPATLRRHLAALVEAGLIIRRDSPNGKRYARTAKNGDIERAFGFDLSPLVVRADEFARLADEVRAEDRALRILRENITLCRRDIAKMLAVAATQGLVSPRSEPGVDLHHRYRSLLAQIPRNAARTELEPIAHGLSELAQEIAMMLRTHTQIENLDATESQTERHIHSSESNNLVDLEPARQQRQTSPTAPQTETLASPAYPLKMVLDACPDALDYAKSGISNWRDLQAVAAVVAQMLGVSPTAWADAQAALGRIPAAIVIAAILQKGAAVASAGGYLRELTRKAQQGEFTIGPMLMALLAARSREKKCA